MAHKIGHGASGTTSQGLGQNGALRNILTKTSGSSDNAAMAMALAQQFVPLAPKADPWEAAFQFFAEMGKQASVPGSTALGAGVSSLQVPMDYLNAKKKELRDSKAAQAQMALTIGAGLKDPESTTYKEQKFYKVGFPAAVVKNESDAAGFTDSGWATTPPEGWKPPAGSKTSATVQSSKMLDGNVTVSLFNDGTREVRGPDGEILTGTAAKEAVDAAEERGITITSEKAGGRRAATVAVNTSLSAFDKVNKSRTKISNLQEAKRLILEEGANTGFIVDNFPSWKDSTIALDAIKNELGLDVVGSVTFGALSEGELNLALSTALPTRLDEDGLVDWIERKISAQSKLQDYLYGQAVYLSDGDKTIGDWLRSQEEERKQKDLEEAKRRQQGNNFDFTTMEAAELQEIDLDTLTDDQFDAWSKRMTELGL